MTIGGIIILLVVVGVALSIFPNIDPTIKRYIYIALGILLLLAVLSYAGLLGGGTFNRRVL